MGKGNSYSQPEIFQLPSTYVIAENCDLFERWGALVVAWMGVLVGCRVCRGEGGLLVAGNLRRFLISCLVFCVKILGWDNFWYVFGVFCCFFLRFTLFLNRFLLENTHFWVSFTQKIATLLYFLRKFPGTRKFPLIKPFMYSFNLSKTVTYERNLTHSSRKKFVVSIISR